MYRARFILNYIEHEVLYSIKYIKQLDKSHVVDVFSAAIKWAWYQGDLLYFLLKHRKWGWISNFLKNIFPKLIIMLTTMYVYMYVCMLTREDVIWNWYILLFGFSLFSCIWFKSTRSASKILHFHIYYYKCFVLAFTITPSKYLPFYYFLFKLR